MNNILDDVNNIKDMYWSMEMFLMYYLKHEQECLSDIKHEAMGECFISDKTRTASVLNDFYQTH